MHPPAQDLLDWYDRHRRVLPWRAASEPSRAGTSEASRPSVPDPYRVWLSEVMLQQTTAAAVAPRYGRFLTRFPDVQVLAAACWEEVATEWAGLGYYARARNLHAAARTIVALGGFPDTEVGLRALPGVGAYTAAAVAAIAFDRPTVPLDGNIERICSRVFAVAAPLPGSRPRLSVLANGFMEQRAARARPGDFAQALFDLGATVCVPRRPGCVLCPWREPCSARRQGVQDALPTKSPKPARTLRHGTHFLLRDAVGRVLLRRRPPNGLLGGMAEIPGTPWREAPWSDAEAMPYAPVDGPSWHPLARPAAHGFTHMDLSMRVFVAILDTRSVTDPAPDGFWWEGADTVRDALPTAMRRILELAGRHLSTSKPIG